MIQSQEASKADKIQEHEELQMLCECVKATVGIEIPKIDVRFQNLSVAGDAYVESRAFPTLLNSTMNAIEGIIGMVGLSRSKKRVIKILHDTIIFLFVRMTLLLGPPGSGKTTLLKALAGKSDDNLKISGKVTYCGREFKEFVPQRTSAYISQHDLHYGEMTVRETLDFSGRCLGVGTRYEMLVELSRREKEAGIKPDPEIDAFMKATAVSGQETSLITDYVLKILGLDICADILVGNDMRRGVSGGQKKRVTTGEMLVGPAKAFFMDEISTGLDSSTTFQIVKFMRQMVHTMDVTMVISLLQPAPETFNLFDDVILLSEGQIVYQGPRENVLEFFEYMGFKCPERKGIADFLQEVTSKKDQEQYWFKKNQPYRYVSVNDFAQAFNSFHIGQKMSEDLRIPYDKSKAHPAALVTESYGISNLELFKACFSREWLLMKRNSFVYIFKTTQITIMATIAMTVFLRTEMKTGTVEGASKYLGALFFSLINIMFNGMAELAMTVFRLPVFFKQRDSLFFPAWAFSLPIWLLRIPVSFMESAIWIVLTYYTIGFAPSFTRFLKQFLAFFSVHQTALSLFRFTEECEVILADLKKYLITAPVLSNPVLGEELFLYLVVSEHAVSAVIIREEKGEQMAVYYVNKTLASTETMYLPLEKLTLALVMASKKLNHYFQAHKIMVLTEHPLKSLLQQGDLTARVAKWAVVLGQYDLEFRPKAIIKGKVLAEFTPSAIPRWTPVSRGLGCPAKQEKTQLGPKNPAQAKQKKEEKPKPCNVYIGDFFHLRFEPSNQLLAVCPVGHGSSWTTVPSNWAKEVSAGNN
ncbi:pleiotropic drug resistance protein 2-like [Camellia sinensis]|uniref:pleiotropic drug resistance protein 2-like n=1 Tax=Camellia sinensis TaxID=4442 RepID=UPI001035ADE6|nr:pleiotropic drug resistance protein 2-like [Camellia sinensis]